MKKESKSKVKRIRIPSVSVYLSPETKRGMQDLADANRRSLTGEIEVVLERVLSESAANGAG